jgi:hypothetical protein
LPQLPQQVVVVVETVEQLVDQVVQAAAAVLMAAMPLVLGQPAQFKGLVAVLAHLLMAALAAAEEQEQLALLELHQPQEMVALVHQ